MNTKLTHLPVHWKNGMSFSEDHLNKQQLATVDGLRDASALPLSPFNYGLLGGDSFRRSADSFLDHITNERVQVSHCRAVTQNGSRMEIIDQKWDALSASMTDLIGTKDISRSNSWYVLLIIDVFTRVPTGEINEQEIPRRKPHTRPLYTLELISEDDLQLDDLANAIPLAKFLVSAAGLSKDSEYIPPCTRVNSIDRLVRRFDQYERSLNQIREYADKIIEKVNFKRKNDRDQNRLADDIDGLCKSYLNHFVQNYDEFRLTYAQASPITLVQYFAKLARVLNHTLDMGYDKTHLLQYVNQYASDLNVSELSQVLAQMYQVDYRHYDMVLALEKIDQFLETWEEIFNELTRLDYRELAPRQVVREDTIINTDQRSKSSDSKGIRFKRPGRAENLGDELR